MQNNANKSSEGKNYDRIFDGIIEILLSMYKLTRAGLRTKFYKKAENLILTSSFLFLFWIIVFKKQHLKIVQLIPFELFHNPVANFIYSFGTIWTIVLVTLFVLLMSIMFAGLRSYKIHLKYQRALDHLNLKSGLGHRPTVVNVDSLDESRTRILVKSPGLGQERYKTKLDDLRSAFGQKIESVCYLEKNNEFVEISLAHKLLQNNIKYSELIENVNRPFGFVVGKSLQGVITENLEDVPHYLIAGSTGGGKSVAFKNMLLGLLESSKRVQLYIFDFKQVEMNEFSVLPNVKVIKDEDTAAMLLEEFVKEMDRRYKLLEDNKEKKIDPDRDKLDRIVIGIDECSDLLGKVSKNDPKYKAVETARRCLNELSRKARASGIHLIFATQKVDKNSIDTQIQENLEGRLSFRMNTIENSVRVLQNGMSYYLPSIAGRAIWKKGANYTEVQCPFLSDEELNERIEVLSEKMASDGNKMIELSEPQVEDVEAQRYVEDTTLG